MDNLILDINELYRTGAFVAGAIFGLFSNWLILLGTNKERKAFLELILQREEQLTTQLYFKDERILGLQDFINTHIINKKKE